MSAKTIFGVLTSAFNTIYAQFIRIIQNGSTITNTPQSTADELVIQGGDVGISILGSSTSNIFLGNNSSTLAARIWSPNASQLSMAVAGVEMERISLTGIDVYVPLRVANNINCSVGGIRFPNGATDMTWYGESSLQSQFNSSGGTNNIFSGSVTIGLTRIGRLVILQFPDALNSTAFALGYIATATNLPASYRPAADFYDLVRVKSGVNIFSGLIYVLAATGEIRFYQDETGANFVGSANSGFYNTCVTYSAT